MTILRSFYYYYSYKLLLLFQIKVVFIHIIL